jgi:hypothetical protein
LDEVQVLLSYLVFIVGSPIAKDDMQCDMKPLIINWTVKAWL